MRFIQKVTLIIFGIFLFFISLELILRAWGGCILFLQECKNLFSLRDKQYRILCLGESTTIAPIGEDCYPSQLEKILNSIDTGNKFSVINKGRPGVNTSWVIRSLEDNLRRYKPDMVIAMMGINDHKNTLAYQEDHPTFINSMRVYKLAKLIRLRIITNFNMANAYPRINNVTSMQQNLSKVAEAKGYNSEAQGIYDEAEFFLKKAISLNPNNDDAYVALAQIYRGRGRRNDFLYSMQMLRKAVRLNPWNDRAYSALGWNYLKGSSDSAQVYRAKDYFEKALQLNNKNDDAYFGLATYYIKVDKDYMRAKEALQKVIEIGSDNTRAYSCLLLLNAKIGTGNEISYPEATRTNYKALKEIMDRNGIKLICVQYPMRSIAPLKKIFENQRGIIFVDNEIIFKDAVKNFGYTEYFTDMFAGDFGHCTPKGNRLLAENIAKTVLNECAEIKSEVIDK